MNVRASSFAIFLLTLSIVPACGGATTPPGGDAGFDAASAPDTSVPTPDTGVPTPDTGVPTPDTGVPTPDTGVPTSDAGHDAAAPGIDADVPDTGGPCPAQPTDLSAMGMDCRDSACPAGFTCQGFSGIIFAQSCQIRCEPGGCPCPSGTGCVEVGDKGGSWHECHFLDD